MTLLQLVAYLSFKLSICITNWISIDLKTFFRKINDKYYKFGCLQADKIYFILTNEWIEEKSNKINQKCCLIEIIQDQICLLFLDLHER